MNFYLLFLIIIIFICLFYNKKNTSYENFNNKVKGNIWMYWENMPGKKKASYLDLCYKTVLKNCKKNFNIHLLDDKTVYDFLPNLRRDLDDKLKIQQKVDYIRYLLLYKYGGIWVDSDTIVFKNLNPLIRKLKDYDFVGFGCHFKDQKKCSQSGYPYPANWVMASRKNGVLMKRCVDKCNYYLNNGIDLRKKYHKIGRELLWSEIKYLLKNNKLWKYYHYNSKCIERDSKNNKFYNSRTISNENIDKYCEDKFLFIPIYNSAPGFPKWFNNMTEKNILKSNMLISKLFRKSLRK